MDEKKKSWWERVQKEFGIIFSKFSKLFDRIIYHKTSSIIVSLLASIAICVSVSFDDLRYTFFNSEAATLNVPGVSVEVRADTEKYEITGVPSSVDMTLTGDPADIQAFRNQSNSALVIADLRDFTSGKNVCMLQASNIPSQLTVELNPSSVNVDVIPKLNKTFPIQLSLMVGNGQKESDFESMNSMTKTVMVKATQEKLNSIRMINAIVDTTGQVGDFETEAPLVAYDSSGNRVDVEMNPKTIRVSVKVKTQQNDTNKGD